MPCCLICRLQTDHFFVFVELNKTSKCFCSCHQFWSVRIFQDQARYAKKFILFLRYIFLKCKTIVLTTPNLEIRYFLCPDVTPGIVMNSGANASKQESAYIIIQRWENVSMHKSKMGTKDVCFHLNLAALQSNEMSKGKLFFSLWSAFETPHSCLLSPRFKFLCYNV